MHEAQRVRYDNLTFVILALQLVGSAACGGAGLGTELLHPAPPP